MRRIIDFLFLIFLLSFVSSQATTRQGGKGLIYVHSARVLEKGHLEFVAGTRFFGKIANFGSSKVAYTLWNVQGFSSFNYGITPHIEFSFSPIFYQDTNSDGGNALDGQANIPDDIFIGLKAGSFREIESPFIFGAILYTRIPAAKQHNIIYEPYSAGTIEVGLKGIASYYSNPTFLDEGWSVHCNIGYLNHNDVGTKLTGNPDDVRPGAMSAELLFGIGIRYPAGTFDFSSEINARYFITPPPETAYSREYVSYLTAGVYYMPYPWITFQMGIDIKLISEKDISQYVPDTSLDPPPEKFPNYPTWRGVLGVRMAILPFGLYSSESARLRREAEDRRKILEKMLKEQKDTNSAESELQKIRASRKKLEEELERIRKLLEQEGSKKKGKKKKKK